MSANGRTILQWFGLFWTALALAWFFFPAPTNANIIFFKDTLSTSVATSTSDHTIQFQTTKAIAPGESIIFQPGPGFYIPVEKYAPLTASGTPGTTTDSFGYLNVELYVNNGGGYTKRKVGSTTNATTDGVSFTSGYDGEVQVTLNSTTGIPANAWVRFLIGTHTASSTEYDTSITNPGWVDAHPFYLSKTGTNAVTRRGWVATTELVGMGPIDTTETIPPYRFNGAPTSTVPGTTLSVEVRLETDEFAFCRYSFTSGTPWPNGTLFEVTGLINHSFVMAVIPDSNNYVYVRCIDDEDNFNTDDYEISFYVQEAPTGSAADENETPGDGEGTGTGDGTDGSGTGASTGSGGGSSSSSGGGGAGSSGGTGDDEDDTAGGGFETSDDAYPSGDGQVIINGYAFPNSTVVALVDGIAAETDSADSSGKYSITINDIARGVYNFGVYAIDKNAVRSGTFTTTFTVTGSRSSSLSNINVMPSILVEPDPVNIGDTLTVTGYTIPNATVTIENQNESTSASLKTFSASSDSAGKWSLTMDTNTFIKGTYKIRAKAEGAGVSTKFSDYTYYGVGQEAEVALNADLNRDGKVNLTDFSILLYWWGTNGGDSDPPADINRDGNVTLTDFSILLFNWTG